MFPISHRLPPPNFQDRSCFFLSLVLRVCLPLLSPLHSGEIFKNYYFTFLFFQKILSGEGICSNRSKFLRPAAPHWRRGLRTSGENLGRHCRRQCFLFYSTQSTTFTRSKHLTAGSLTLPLMSRCIFSIRKSIPMGLKRRFCCGLPLDLNR